MFPLLSSSNESTAYYTVELADILLSKESYSYTRGKTEFHPHSVCESNLESLKFRIKRAVPTSPSVSFSGKSMPACLQTDFFKWKSGEPNNYGGNEDCTHLKSICGYVGPWNDNDCDKKQRYICKTPRSESINCTVFVQSFPKYLLSNM